MHGKDGGRQPAAGREVTLQQGSRRREGMVESDCCSVIRRRWPLDDLSSPWRGLLSERHGEVCVGAARQGRCRHGAARFVSAVGEI